MGFRDQTRISRVNAFNIGVYLADLSPKANCQSHGGSIRATPPQSGYVHLIGNPLEAGDDNDITRLQFLTHPPGLYLKNTSPAVCRIGTYPRLSATQANRGITHAVQCHRQQGAGDNLPRGKKDIKFPPVRIL